MSYSDLTESQRLWVDALRSGEFEQCKEYLHLKEDDTHRYCCLGVACELYVKYMGKIDKTEFDNDHENIIRYAYNGEYESLPPEVQDWLGLNNGTGKCEGIKDLGITDRYYGNPIVCLAGLNDNANYNFQQIADVIESRPEGLFKAQSPQG